MNIDSSGSPQTFGRLDLTNEQYHGEKGHVSRSYAHQIYRYGGVGQKLLEQGVKLVGMNSGLKTGSLFDAYWEAKALGEDTSKLFVVAPPEVLAADGSRRGKAYTDWVKNQSGQIVTQADLDLLALMWAGVEACDRAMELLANTSDTQRSVFWHDRNGHARKARFDGQTSELVYDVKTTSSQWDQVYKSFLDYGYVWQSGWYQDAAYQIEYEPFRMPFVVVQTVPPYECAVFVLPSEFIDAARDQIDRTLDAIRLRRETGEYFPADYGVEKEMVFPGWAWTKEVYGNASVTE